MTAHYFLGFHTGLYCLRFSPRSLQQSSSYLLPPSRLLLSHSSLNDAFKTKGRRLSLLCSDLSMAPLLHAESLECPQVQMNRLCVFSQTSNPTTLSLVKFALASSSSLLAFLRRNSFPAFIRKRVCFSKLKKKVKKSGKIEEVYSNSPMKIKRYPST